MLHRADAHIRRRLRAIQLKHWKRKRTKAKRLLGLGADRDAVMTTIYGRRRGIWQLGHTRVVDQALNVAYFRLRGLLSLEQAHADWQSRKSLSHLGIVEIAV